jgi:dimethylargininase
MTARSTRFSHAITRAPDSSLVDGLRAVDRGAPDLDLFKAHHADYIAALRATGATVITLAPLAGFPDAVFVEDTALCLPEGAIIMRPGVPSRLGEVRAMAPVLAGYYGEVRTVEGPGHIEGGDILTTEREILVGRSSRTDAHGIDELRRLVAPWNYRVREVRTPLGVLHFKTDCALVDEETILATDRLAASGCFDGYRLIRTPAGEEAAANAVRFNELLLLPAGFPRTADRLSSAGYTIREIGNSEAAKLDGGMSCLSLRFTPGKGAAG